ncbi:hypothetical protein UlMin_002000 [Ulmus minor]
MDATLWQYYRARKTARNMIEGTISQQYAMLGDYCAELLRMNPGIYFCLTALKRGWTNGCRKIIGLDGCFVKVFHKGQLITTVGVDPNNQMYPIAYAVVEAKTRETWYWFLENLQSNLQLHNSHGVAWITDKQKGLIDAISELFPHSEHRYCPKNLHNNFKVKHKGLLLKQTFWATVKSTTTQRFEQNMETIKLNSVDAYEWLAKKHPSHWSRAFFQFYPKCDMVCNNICEAFNFAIISARDKPIITLLEMIMNYLMKRLTRKREEVSKWTHPVGPKVFKFMEKVKLETAIC